MEKWVGCLHFRGVKCSFRFRVMQKSCFNYPIPRRLPAGCKTPQLLLPYALALAGLLMSSSPMESLQLYTGRVQTARGALDPVISIFFWLLDLNLHSMRSSRLQGSIFLSFKLPWWYWHHFEGASKGGMKSLDATITSPKAIPEHIPMEYFFTLSHSCKP